MNLVKNKKRYPAAAIIPARFGSTRFPGKPLADLGGRTVIEWVWRAAKASAVEIVLVATDDRRIAREVERFGGRVTLTSPEHSTGTERVAEAAHSLDPGINLVINVQGDEPFLRPEMIDQVAEGLLSAPPPDAVTLVKEIDSEDEYLDPGVVKAAVDSRGFALYFSRSPIPYRGFPSAPRPFKHIGIYGFQRDFIRVLVSLPPGALEEAERLEQLRILENGYKIRALATPRDTIGIDTPADLQRARELIGGQGND